MFTGPGPGSAAGSPLPMAAARRPLIQLPNAGEEAARKPPGCLGFLAALRVARHLMLMDFQLLLGRKSTYDSFENPAVHTLAGLASQRSTKQNHRVSANRVQHIRVAPLPLAGFHLYLTPMVTNRKTLPWHPPRNLQEIPI